MRSVESSAKTMEEAVTLGLEKLGVSLGDVKIDILDEGSKGFLGFLGGKPVVVRLTMREAEEKSSILSSLSLDATANKPASGREGKKTAKKPNSGEAEAKQDAPKAEKKPVVKAKQEKPAEKERPAMPKAAHMGAENLPKEAVLCDPETQEGKAQQFLMKVTEMMGVQVSVHSRRDEQGNVRVDMFGDTLGILIGRRGETLDALQYLSSLHINHGRDEYTRVTLDTESYRAKREEALTRLANRMANRAVKTGRKVVMEPMNPYERRILHSALQGNEAVTTHSEGEEPNRHVVITLK